MADDATRVKNITDAIEGTYQAMRKAASNIAGLLQLGKATCAEVRAYNLWALAVYNEQRGMLETARAAGQTGLPSLPPSPTLFTWRGVQGQDAWKIDCPGSSSTLSGAMSGAMRDSKVTQYLSTNELQITTQDQFLYNPESAPSFATLFNVQQARAQQAGLGIAFIIVIAGIAITAIAVAVAALSRYFETKEIQEGNAKQVKLQADAFANYTAARLACYADCTRSGQSAEKCVEICKGLVKEPSIKTSFSSDKWGFLQWTGLTVVVGASALVAYKIYQRRKQGKPVFELPAFEASSAA